jgi:hypothetical protein
MTSKIGWISVGEVLIAPRICPVAVCCSSASVTSRLRTSNSLNNRTFSIAITAWSANVSRSAICLAEKGWTSGPRVMMMTPSGVPSRSRGVATAVRTREPVCLTRATDTGNSASVSAAMTSATWIVCRSITTRPPRMSRLTGTRSPIASDRRSGPCSATTRRWSPSTREIIESVAPHTRAAFSAMVFRTGCRSVGELAMTRKISAVAVCCSKVSVRSRLRCSSSLNRRTFSMAMSAWVAKVWSRAIWRSLNGRTSRRHIPSTPIAAPSRSSGTPSPVRHPTS